MTHPLIGLPGMSNGLTWGNASALLPFSSPSRRIKEIFVDTAEHISIQKVAHAPEHIFVIGIFPTRYDFFYSIFNLLIMRQVQPPRVKFRFSRSNVHGKNNNLSVLYSLF
jgi:hypothetical protein